jgi:3-oxoacyl-ACP reductase-like protein
MISITLQYATVQEAQVALAKLNGAENKDKPAPKSATTDKPAASSPTASAPAPAPAAPAAKKYEDTKLPDLIRAAAAKDKPAVVALLAKFGVKKGTELKVEQFDEFEAAVKPIAEGEAEALA